MSKDEDRAYRKTCYDISFNLDEMQKSNCLISGTNSTGKSRLACGIASILRTFNWQVIAFDSVGNWREISDIPYYQRIQPSPRNPQIFVPQTEIYIPSESIIYDTSLLLPSEQIKFVDDYLQVLWNQRVITKPQQWCLVIFEEFHLYGKNVRTKLAENLLRMMSVGRNYKVRILGITPDLALIDPAFIRLAQQRYHGKIGIEENSKRKFRACYGLDWTRIACEDLSTGDFLYVLGNKLRIISVPLFTARTLPTAYKGQLSQKPRISIFAKIKRLFK